MAMEYLYKKDKCLALSYIAADKELIIVKSQRKADEVVQLKGKFNSHAQSILITKLSLDLQTYFTTHHKSDHAFTLVIILRP